MDKQQADALRDLVRQRAKIAAEVRDTTVLTTVPVSTPEGVPKASVKRKRAASTPRKPTAFHGGIGSSPKSLAALPGGSAAGAARPRGKRTRTRFDDVAAYQRAARRIMAESPAYRKARLHKHIRRLRHEMRADGRPRREIRAACASLVREYNI